MRFKVLILVILSLVVFNCSSDDDNTNEASCTFDIPFVVEGNKWIMDVTALGLDAGQIENEIIGCGNDGLEVILTGPNESVTSIWKQEDGYLWTDVNDAVNSFNRFYKINAQVGDTFSYTQNNGSEHTREVIAVDSTITVPAGTFICDVYKKTSTNASNEIFLFWNHEIGQIKTDNGLTILELASYNFD